MKWFLAGIALGALLTADVKHAHVYELRIYHATPGKVKKLEDRFRDAQPLFNKHNLNVTGYWVVDDPTKPDWNDTFVYVVAHDSVDDAKKTWKTIHSDPAFQKYRDEEKAEPLIPKDESVFLRPTDYSAAQ